MKTSWMKVFFIGLCVALTSCAHKQSKEKPAQQQTASPATTSSSGTTSGDMSGVTVTESLIIDTKALPLDLLSDARQQFQAEKYEEASVSLKAAGRALQIEANSTNAKVPTKEINTAISTVNRLAQRVRAGEIKALQDFDSQLAEVAYNKAVFEDNEARQAWNTKQYKFAGHGLEAARLALNAGADWGGDAVQFSPSEIRSVQETTRKLQTGTGFTTTEVRTAFQSIQSATTKMGQGLAQAAREQGVRSPASIEGPETNEQPPQGEGQQSAPSGQ